MTDARQARAQAEALLVAWSKHCPPGVWVGGFQKHMFVALIEAALLAARQQWVEEAAKVVEAWGRQYPTDVFIEPPQGQHGETVDACSARAIRFACRRLAEVIRSEEHIE